MNDEHVKVLETCLNIWANYGLHVELDQMHYFEGSVVATIPLVIRLTTPLITQPTLLVVQVEI